MTKVRRVDFSPDEWLSGTAALTMEERGFYITICALIYSHGKPLNDDHKHISRLCGVTTSRWIRVRDALIQQEKIQIIDGKIVQKRCEIELERSQNRTEKARISGKIGGNLSGISRKNHENLGKNHQNSEFFAQNQGVVSS